MNLSASWISRGLRSVEMTPKAGSGKFRVPPALPSEYCGWLKALNISARNSSLAVSPAAQLWNLPNHGNSKALKKERSQLLIPGPRRTLRPALPKVPSAGTENAAVLKYPLIERLSLGRLGSPLRLGRWHS